MTHSKEASITILIAIYNGEKTLERAFESLKRQTFQDFSVLSINDASLDKTSEILRKWQSFFGEGRFRIIENEINLGLTSSLNKGLREVTTHFVARLDADDWWHEKKLKCQIDFIEQHPEYGLLGCNYINITKKGSRSIVCQENDHAIRKSILRRNPFAHSCVIFNTTLAKKLNGYDEHVRYGQDYDLWLRMLPHTKMHNVQEFLCFRNAEGGISQDKQNSQMKQCIRTQLKYLKMYHRPFWEYTVILEPLLVILVPEFLKKYKRSLS